MKCDIFIVLQRVKEVYRLEEMEKIFVRYAWEESWRFPLGWFRTAVMEFDPNEILPFLMTVLCLQAGDEGDQEFWRSPASVLHRQRWQTLPPDRPLHHQDRQWCVCVCSVFVCVCLCLSLCLWVCFHSPKPACFNRFHHYLSLNRPVDHGVQQEP